MEQDRPMLPGMQHRRGRLLTKDLGGRLVHRARHDAQQDEWRGNCRCAVSPVPDQGAVTPAYEDVLEDERLRAIGFLTASLSHEFNNPLCGVSSVLERMMRKSDLTDAEQHLLQLANDQCSRMKQLLQALQEFAHTPCFHRTPFDLHRALASVLRITQKQLQRSRVTLHPVYPPTPLMLEGFESQVKLMLLHLLQSTCQCLSPCGCALTMDTVLDTSWVRIVLQYQVPEADTADLVHLFASVVLSDPAVDPGLPLLQTILDMHGGFLRQAAPSRGSGALILFLPVGGDKVSER
jgi:nitrogen-specific signal transduction histidine kinase